jgi:hypothetical protein
MCIVRRLFRRLVRDRWPAVMGLIMDHFTAHIAALSLIRALTTALANDAGSRRSETDSRE